MELRFVINSAFKIFNAMNNKDYDYLDSAVTKNVKIDRETNEIVSHVNGRPSPYPFLKEVDFGNIEYWGFGMDGENRASFNFARFHTDGHAEFTVTFIKEGNKWKLDSYISTRVD